MSGGKCLVYCRPTCVRYLHDTKYALKHKTFLFLGYVMTGMENLVCSFAAMFFRADLITFLLVI